MASKSCPASKGPLAYLLAAVALCVLLIIPAVSVARAANPKAASPGTPQAHTIDAFVAGQLAQGKKPNRLIKEKSPYLLQHAFNPIDWYPWGPEALAKAKRENKPIFLSIGYSTCHWCHVMAAESFSDPAVGAILNQYFVAIKLDREERPDLDRVYMAATQALTGSGGWPNSVFLTPDLQPFYAGTYFPPKSRWGLPGFSDLLLAVRNKWEQDPKGVSKAAGEITRLLKNHAALPASSKMPPDDLPAEASKQLATAFDRAYGGFGMAPKFPRPVVLYFLLRNYHYQGNQNDREMVLVTLKKMAAGGIHDHLGGGFHRYSVDEQWRVPHFEKMLYDQAALAVAYLEAFQVSGDPAFARVARGILDYVLRDLTGPDGGFYSAEDADSPLPEDPKRHGEGAFYLWSHQELRDALGKETAAVFTYRYGVEQKGNVLHDPHGEFKGKNILYEAHSLAQTAKHFGLGPEKTAAILAGARQKLLELRSRRPRSQLDDKVLTAWNGLMISAMARGYQVLGDARYLAAARRAAAFIKDKLYDPKTGELSRRFRQGQAGLAAHLDDYAYLVRGLLDLFEASQQIARLNWARQLNATQTKLFGDPKGGGYYSTAGRDQTVLTRGKEKFESARPSGNAVAALNLLRLANLTQDDAMRKRAETVFKAYAGHLKRHPTSMPLMLAALLNWQHPYKQVVIAGRPGADDTRRLLAAVHRKFLPGKMVVLATGGADQKRLAGLMPFLEGMAMQEGKATAYVCLGYTCRLPTNDVEAVSRQLEDIGKAR